jgi:hypothetical protein
MARPANGPELIGDTAPLLFGCLGIVLGEGGSDEGRDDTPSAAAAMGQHVAHEVDAGVVEDVRRDEGYAQFQRSCQMANIVEPERWSAQRV